ncbi:MULTISPECIES: hypothetical protein [Rhizobium]|uniref:Uncharacterized protein n=1 Tax=Rhizobium tropici TaxID=398 RepID=A0A329YIY9_RHITR|nr:MULTISPECIES: hypothetical protein [Rhizobium]MBB3286184.1 hypothetical protein [Rhizobium sp. BK252]MBB3400654.1 hypothetical protein [Rhizobium sp. BK289]MBB3413502.1 hypothetical protein [Rhizobium sp. BK284]MBB3481120.1 hypothetical protein [Rhizobium sp. BK347]MDK4723603.1 hypothetical protein [Rhizobium sp. CNPSo 3968]
MSHHHYSDGQVGEEREFYSSEERSEGEREYYEHVRTPRASILNSAVTVCAIVLVLSIAFGYRASTAPTPQPAVPPIVQKIMIAPPADPCADSSPYPGREC